MYILEKKNDLKSVAEASVAENSNNDNSKAKIRGMKKLQVSNAGKALVSATVPLRG